jgi:FdhE protein
MKNPGLKNAERQGLMIEPLNDFYNRMTDRLKQLRQERSELEEILSFYDKVLAAQQETQQQISVPEPDLTEDTVELKIEEGFPLIAREYFQVDKEISTGLFQNLCQLSLEENPVLASAGKNLLEAMDSEKLDFDNLVKAIVQDETEIIKVAAEDLGVPLPVLQAMTKMSLQPSLLATVAAVSGQTAMDTWHYWYCPICGGLPAMAALVGEEGKREALCSFCGHFWQLPRLGCPFCDTDKQEDLRYFYGEGEDHYRVHVCEKCRGYLKVLDTRKGGDPRGLAVDDVATGHLDLLAEEEGYQRKAPRLWGI